MSYHNEEMCFATYQKEEENEIICKVSGMVIYREITFKFHLTRQTRGKYFFRGTISAVASDGRVLQYQGKKRKEILERLIKKHFYTDEKDAERYRNKELNVSKEVNVGSPSEEEIKLRIEKGIEKLYQDNALVMMRELKESFRADSIKPLVAVEVYFSSFLDKSNNLSEKSRKNYTLQIKKLMKKLPDKPMAEIRQTQLEAAIKGEYLSKNAQKRLYLFWQYLIENGYVSGNNPVPRLRKSRPLPETLQHKGSIPRIMTLKQQDELYKALYQGDVSGSDCGIALGVWGGLDWFDNVKWRHIHFDKEKRDLAVVEIRKENMAGATHDFSRPILPFAVSILRKRFESLQKDYSDAELMEMPVISMGRYPSRAMSNETFLGEAVGTLRRIGLPAEMFKYPRDGERIAAAKRIMLDTYRNTIYTRLGFENDEGTARFLCGETLKDVTSDAYTKFNDPEGIDRIHTAETLLSPKKTAQKTKEEKNRLDGRKEYICRPTDNRRKVTVLANLTLQPGEEVEIICPHGATIVAASSQFGYPNL